MMHCWLAQDTCYILTFLINILVQYSQNLLLLGEKRRKSWGFAALYSLQLLRGAKELNMGGKKPLPLLNPSCCGLFLLFLLSSSTFPLQNSHEAKQAQLKKVAPSLLLPSLTSSRGELQRRDARRESSSHRGGGVGGRWEKQGVSLQYIPTHIALLSLGN